VQDSASAVAKLMSRSSSEKQVRGGGMVGGVGKESVRRWVIQSQVDGGHRAGATSEELAEIKALKAENRRLREDVEILRGATTFFVGELDPRNR
jgi:transposase-like protein